MNDRFGSPQLVGTFYTDETYSKNHAHMVHKHEKVLELLYIASGEGRYQVGHREYAVHAGNLIICNGNTLHGEAPVSKTYDADVLYCSDGRTASEFISPLHNSAPTETCAGTDRER